MFSVMPRNGTIATILFLLVVAGDSRTTKKANELVDNILKLASKHITYSTLLPNMRVDLNYKFVGAGLNITSVGAIVQRDSLVPNRTRDVRSGWFSSSMEVLQVPVDCGEVRVQLDNIQLNWGLFKFKTNALLALTSPFLAYITLEKNPGQKYCVVSFFVYRPPEIEIRSVRGSGMFSTVVAWFLRTFSYRQVTQELAWQLFGGPFVKTTVQAFDNATIDLICR